MCWASGKYLWYLIVSAPPCHIFVLKVPPFLFSGVLFFKAKIISSLEKLSPFHITSSSWDISSTFWEAHFLLGILCFFGSLNFHPRQGKLSALRVVFLGSLFFSHSDFQYLLPKHSVEIVNELLSSLR